MKQRISVLTLGVDDLERSLRFYRDGLGWKTDGIIGREFEHGAVVFFELQSGLRLGLWEKENIAWDSGLPLSTGSSLQFTIGHNVASEKEVRRVMQLAEEAGAKIIKPASKTFYNGFAGYFTDPDGHLWEVVYNPAFIPE